jgi:hypothetical protein
VQVVGVPVAPSAGSTHCVTVTGVTGTLKTGGSGALVVVSATPVANRSGTWTVCFTIGQGIGTLYVEAGGKSLPTAMRGR